MERRQRDGEEDREREENRNLKKKKNKEIIKKAYLNEVVKK